MLVTEIQIHVLKMIVEFILIYQIVKLLAKLGHKKLQLLVKMDKDKQQVKHSIVMTMNGVYLHQLLLGKLLVHHLVNLLLVLLFTLECSEKPKIMK